MSKSITRSIATAGVALALSLGTITPASAAGNTAIPAIHVVQAASTSSAINLTWNKTVAFAGCITSVGVPIGIAWTIATNPAALAWILNRGPLPASIGAPAYRYMSYVKSTCGYALLNIVYR
jgi:hypothetical protein